MDPYRDELATCPACAAPLRRFGERLVCDACTGIFLDVADFTRSLVDLTQDVVAIAFTHDTASTRACPRCATPMTRGRLEATVGTKCVRVRGNDLDRC